MSVLIVILRRETAWARKGDQWTETTDDGTASGGWQMAAKFNKDFTLDTMQELLSATLGVKHLPA